MKNEDGRTDINSADKASRENTEEESAMAKRIRGLEGSTELREQKDEILMEPKTLLEKLENFWYHFKWPTLIVSFFLIIGVVCITQIVTKDDPDIYLMYAGPASLSVNGIHAIQESFETFGEDRNGDGKRLASLLDLVALTEPQMDELEKKAREEDEGLVFDRVAIKNARQRFSNEITVGDTVICILDPHMYESPKEAGAFMPLSEIFDTLPEGVISEDGYSVLLSSTDFGRKFAGVNELPKDTLICIRTSMSLSAIVTANKNEALHNYHVELFRKLITYKSEG